MKKSCVDKIKDPLHSPYPLSKAEVARLYYEEQISLRELAAIAGTSRQCLARWMEYWELPRRNRHDARNLYADKRAIPRSPNWRGGQYKIKASNTWFIYAPNHPRANSKGVVRKHILVAEERIGRYLKEGETVHHLDGDRDNNIPENLCVMPRSEHTTIHNTLGKVGVALLIGGYFELVLKFIPQQDRRRLIELVYVEQVPCIGPITENPEGGTRVEGDLRELMERGL